MDRIRDTAEIVEDLRRIAGTMDALGDFKKASVLIEAAERCEELLKIADFFQREVLRLCSSGRQY